MASFPQNKTDVAGRHGRIGRRGLEEIRQPMLPGAICEHLTSFGGIMSEGAGQTPLSEFLRFGAAGSSGTVVEPMALQQKFPTAFMHVHYARGASLAEAFYQSVFGPYQLLIVGDALCQPWAQRLTIEVAGVQPDQRVSGQDHHGAAGVRTRVTATPAVDHFEVFVDGKRMSDGPGQPTIDVGYEPA